MDFGAFGWQGFQNRALEFPSGVTDGFEVEVSPTGRARLRYNDVLKQLELSIDGNPYLPISVGSSSVVSPGISSMNVYMQSEPTAAERRVPFYLVNAADGITPVTGLVFAGAEIQISENGAAFANFTGSMTEVGDGLYYYTFTVAEIDTLGFVAVKVEIAGVRTSVVTSQVVAYDPNLPAVGTWSQPQTGAVAGTMGWSQLISLYNGAHGPGIYVDTYYPGTAGTVLGVNGTPDNPCGDFVTARTLADALGIRCYYIVGLLTLSATHQDWLFVGSGQSYPYDSIDLDDVDCFGATFIGIALTGAFAVAENAGNVACIDCNLSEVDNVVGTLSRCTIRGAINMPTGAFSFPTLQLIDCTPLAPFGAVSPSIGCGGASPTDAQIIVSGYRGELAFTDIADLTTVVMATFDGAEVTFDASCTAAVTPILFGDFELIDLGAVTPNVTAQTQEVVDDVLTAAHGAGPWT